jgi:RNA polymerase sigma factor (sigma-70 family)
MTAEQNVQLTQLDDPSLIALCIDGDSAAWEELVRRYQRLVYTAALRKGFFGDDAADVFQSVCVQLFEHLRSLRDRTRLGSWLITTTNRECYRQSRLSRRAVSLSGSGPDDADAALDAIDDGALADEALIRLEREHEVRCAVERLPERCRELVYLLFYEAERPSYDEISRRLGMPVASIGPTRARCLEKLRAMLES